jgi:DNA-binding transcriptional LysR family regulator
MIERHLPYFAIVAEEQHFQRAADRLGITQSALSRRIQLLEDELGFKLFERLARGVRLSSAGQNFYNDVVRIRRDIDNATASARDIVLGKQGRLKIAISPTAVSSPVVQMAIQRFRKANINVEIDLRIMYSEDQITFLTSGIVDAGIIYFHSQYPNLSYKELSVEKLFLAMPKSDPLSARETLRLADLAETRFIWPERAHSPQLYDNLIAKWNAMGLTPKIAIEVQSGEAALDVVATGLAAGFVMSHLITRVPPSVVVREISDTTIEIPLFLVWRSNYKSPILNHFTSELEVARKVVD